MLSLDRDHRQICKFIDDPDYKRVARHLKRLADAAIRDGSLNTLNSGSQGTLAVPSSAPDVISS